MLRLLMLMLMLMLMLVLIAAPAVAATPEAIEKGLTEARAACRKASDFKNAAVMGKPVMFSDASAQTAVLVTGIWRPPHMNNARGTMLCLYDRRTGKAEAQEARDWSAPRPR